MFRPKEDYDMPDPFEYAKRVRKVPNNNPDHMVARFTLSQPDPPKEPLTRRQVGRALHRAACRAQVVGTVYEREDKAWRRGGKYDLVVTLPVAIHGSSLDVVEFMRAMEKKHQWLYGLMQPGYTLRTLATWGGKPGDIVKPKSQRYTRFGRKRARTEETEGKKEPPFNSINPRPKLA